MAGNGDAAADSFNTGVHVGDASSQISSGYGIESASIILDGDRQHSAVDGDS
jgi:hypothetical protein